MLSLLEGEHLGSQAQSGHICSHLKTRIFLAFLCVAHLLDGQAEHLHVLQVDQPVLFLKGAEKPFLIVLGPAFKNAV